jgi:hypothetical protein
LTIFDEVLDDVFILASRNKTPGPVPSLEGRIIHFQMDDDLTIANMIKRSNIDIARYERRSKFLMINPVRDRYKYGPASVTNFVPKTGPVDRRCRAYNRAEDARVTSYLLDDIFTPFDY